MNKYLLLAMVALLMAPGVALSESRPGSPNNGGSGGMTNQSGQGDPAQFQARKAEILKRISERMVELQKRQSCVQAANDRQALMACMPKENRPGNRPGTGER